MSTVKIVPSKENKLITAYKNKKDFGYVQLNQIAMSVVGGWVREQKRSCLVRGEMEKLQSFVKMFPTGELPGRIVIREFVESEVPADIQKKFIREDVDKEEAIAGFIKTTGKDGVELTVGGERILRFAEYDFSGKEEDTFVQHDNTDAVAEFNAERKQERLEQEALAKKAQELADKAAAEKAEKKAAKEAAKAKQTASLDLEDED